MIEFEIKIMRVNYNHSDINKLFYNLWLQVYNQNLKYHNPQNVIEKLLNSNKRLDTFKKKVNILKLKETL